MSPDLLFKIFNNGVIPVWLCLAFAPRWRVTQFMLKTPIVPLFYAAAYLVLLLLELVFSSNAGNAPQGDFFSLDGVTALFSKKEVVLIGWIHYLVFDLWVGMWELSDSQKRGIAHYFIIPCLFLTLMYGPVGFLLYWIIRSLHRRPNTPENQQESVF